MGYIHDLKSNPDQEAFPDATFEIRGPIPPGQCLEALIGSANAWTFPNPNRLIDPGAFAGYDLTGKAALITASVGGNTGTFDIVSNSDNGLILLQNPGSGFPVHYHIHDGPEWRFLRTIQSFAEFISAAGYSYTIKGGKLFTNMPEIPLSAACTVTWSPI